MTLVLGDFYILWGILSLVFLLGSVYLTFAKCLREKGLYLLIGCGTMLRIIIASLDPYLHNWDEKFHALVAKNLSENPHIPILRLEPLLAFNLEDWCCNHIWLHKQPLFLYQMALSIKMFGVSEFSVRVPSIVFGAVTIYLTYDIAYKWLLNHRIAYIAALLYAVSYYDLELTSGRLSLDHNDTTFAFYITLSIWGFVRYVHSAYKAGWLFVIGISVGCAILTKWLTGLLVFSGWFIYFLFDNSYRERSVFWKHIGLALLICLVIFGPWQWYISVFYPLESDIAYQYNVQHIYKAVEGHTGSLFFHILQFKDIYGPLFSLVIPFGILEIIRTSRQNRPITISLCALIVVLVLFFSIVVQTKMPSYTYPIKSLLWIIIAAGCCFIYDFFSKQVYIGKSASIAMVMLISIYSLQPWRIYNYRTPSNTERLNKINNTIIFKNMSKDSSLNGHVVFNCNTFEDIDLMFYSDLNSYHWYPEKEALDSLMSQGYKIACFKNHNEYQLPDYIYDNKSILIIDENLR